MLRSCRISSVRRILFVLIGERIFTSDAVRSTSRSNELFSAQGDDDDDDSVEPYQESEHITHSNLPLCDASVVAETCGYLNGREERSHEDTITPQILGRVLSAPEETMKGIVEDVTSLKLGFGDGALCKKLCDGLVKKLSETMVMPEFTDQGCYNAVTEVKCPIVQTPQDMKEMALAKGRDMPDFHDQAVKDSDVVRSTESILAKRSERRKKGGNSTDEPKIDLREYDSQLSERLLNLFRVFPENKITPEASSLAEGMDKANVSRDDYTSRANEIGKKSVMYLNAVLRKVQARNTRNHIMNWFGSRAYDDESTRQRVIDILNSAITVLNNAHWKFPGPQCSSSTYAYVYPGQSTPTRCTASYEMNSRPCTKYNGKFVVYLCELYMNVTDMEKVEVLTHEASHHATAYTDDVCIKDCHLPRKYQEIAYGRDTCKDLATTLPAAALKNADNFCYYVSDVNGDVPCHSSAVSTTVNGDGDCMCSSREVCYSTSSNRGCYSSSSNRDRHRFYPGCRTCQCMKPDNFRVG
eukprot:TRINITY_DN6318_c0_g1_i3.p1 TRINITY_DN6318_c0_g1~~TRINITY_DN6318_c0_g1_i3.p1  ORF type:complete len:525 (+),score=82.62 TRINITY_DN6318_c0_g1_i3:106-1680(+)